MSEDCLYLYSILRQVLANNFGLSLLCPLWSGRRDEDKLSFNGSTGATLWGHPGLSRGETHLWKCVLTRMPLATRRPRVTKILKRSGEARENLGVFKKEVRPKAQGKSETTNDGVTRMSADLKWKDGHQLRLIMRAGAPSRYVCATTWTLAHPIQVSMGPCNLHWKNLQTIQIDPCDSKDYTCTRTHLVTGFSVKHNPQ